MIEYTKKDLINCLKKVGIKKGDLIYICPQLYTLGKLKDAKTSYRYYQIYYDCIKDLIGKNGTICISAYTFQVQRYGKKFVLEKTKCTSGEFSEFVRNKPGSVRSIHPGFSVVANGKLNKKICNNSSVSSYGFDSPYDRFLNLKGKILNLGMSPGYNPFQHVAEFRFGVPYKYDKLLNSKVYVNNRIIKKDFFSHVRYLNLNWYYDLRKLEKNIKKNNFVKKTSLGSGHIYYFSAQKYLEVALKTLKSNPYSFLNKKPDFIENEVPYDGISLKNEKKINL